MKLYESYTKFIDLFSSKFHGDKNFSPNYQMEKMQNRPIIFTMETDSSPDNDQNETNRIKINKYDGKNDIWEG